MGDPVGYFISFRCYGTWLHGDSRGSVDPRHNRYGDEVRAPEPQLEAFARSRMPRPAFCLSSAMREVVEPAIRQTCAHFAWPVVALSVQADHVHVVLSALEATPERVMNARKSWATRRLREAQLVDAETRPWSRHGSTRYLWTDDDVTWAAAYVNEGQDVPWHEKRQGHWHD